jgi:hypothetical protein
MIFFALGLAWAAPEVRIAPEGPGIVESHQKFTQSSDPAERLACGSISEGLELCYRHSEEGKLPYVQQKHLEEWGARTSDLQDLVRLKTVGMVTSDRYSKLTVEGVDDSVYWHSSRKDGLDAVALLHPKEAEAFVGGPVLLAVPEAGMCILWRRGNGDLNMVLSVGVKEMYDKSSHPVSPLVYTWDEEQWVVWGEAKPAGGE